MNCTTLTKPAPGTVQKNGAKNPAFLPGQIPGFNRSNLSQKQPPNPKKLPPENQPVKTQLERILKKHLQNQINRCTFVSDLKQTI